jgi:hypothetical protein
MTSLQIRHPTAISKTTKTADHTQQQKQNNYFDE